tara:strand:- start:736 stop:1317 length:582 start_codon:yes stop_codon:yes gene_type:complete
MINNKRIYIFSLITLIFLNGCGIYKRADVKDTPVNVKERVQKNIEEGRGVRFGIGKNKGGTFDFASANELWRASVETLDFVPLINASYSGGIIITDWFSGNSSNQNTNKRDLKITVRFLTNEIRSDALKINVHERICIQNTNNCSVNLIQSKIANEIKLAILKKAAFLEKNKINERVKERRKKVPRGSEEKGQ